MRRTSYIRVFAVASAVLALIGTVGGHRLSAQADPSGAARFGIEVARHQTRAELESSFQPLNTTQFPLENETISVPPPTRSSFMATWPSVAGAKGYLLDVSTSSSFVSFVTGYHDLDVGDVAGRIVTGLSRGTTYYYRVRAYGAAARSGYSETIAITTEPSTGLTIHPTFDSSITGDPNATAIEAMINRAIAIYESLFSDPITIEIRFRYASTGPDGTPLPAGLLSQSDTVFYTNITWNTFIGALRADARTSNDNTANASLPATALSTNIRPGSANGRSVGLNTPPAMFANGTVGPGGPYDGIVTLNSTKPFQFNRPVTETNFDAQRVTEHEMDEVIGFGSFIGQNGNDLRPQDLFSWSSVGHRNTTSSGTRYFSIDGGVTNIVGFNQDPNGDFGDWLSGPCPQVDPYPQNAFACAGESSDIAATSPEGINLDVIGYDLIPAPPPTATPTPTPGPPIVLTSPATNVRNFSATLNGTVNPNGSSTAVHFEYGTTINYGTSTSIQNYSGSTTRSVFANVSNLSAGATYHFRIVGSNAGGTTYGADSTFTTPAARAVVADFNGDSMPDLLVQQPSSHQTAAWYLNNNVVIGAAFGLTLPSGWSIGGAADFDGDGSTDQVVFNSATGQTVLIYLSGMTIVGAAVGPSLSPGWELVETGDFNGDGHPDYVLYQPSTGETAIWHLNNNVFLSATTGPPLPSNWNLVGVADFNSDGHPDYALFNSVTGETLIAYLSDGTIIGAAFGPAIPVNWPLVATADFSQDGHPDYLLYNPVTGLTAIAYLDDTLLIGAALGPTLPAGWSLIGP
jgi:hypothetical protein